MDLTTILIASGAVVGSFILPIRWLHSGHTKMKLDLTNLERRAVRRDEVERMISLYTDPIKEDVHATKMGVDGLIEKFHRLELLIARDLGRKAQHGNSES